MRPAAMLLGLLVAAGPAGAQTLPSEPVTFGDGRVVIGGDVAVAMAPEDRGFFNYADYEQSTLRQLRLGLSGLVRVTDRVAVLAELRSENFAHVTPFALYARIQPFAGRRVDIQVGRIPPTFGAATRRAYTRDNPLIGHPLAYQYLTSLRADAVPASVDELLRMRGRGWLANYSIGNLEPARGVPLVSSFTWDTGVQVSGGWRMVTVAAAVTSGTTSNPRVADDNRGKQIALRASVEPLTGLVAGTSFARGEFLDRRVRGRLGASGSYPQRAHGVDLEYSRGHGVIRGHAVFSEWTLPVPSASSPVLDLRALATSVEGRYTLLPGVYAAARAEHLAFNRVTGATRRDEWDAPVTRVEVGGGYYLQRNLVARVSVQWNARDGGRVRRGTFTAGQLLYWF